MKEFVESTDRRYPIQVQIMVAEEDFRTYGDRRVFNPPITQIDVTFRLPGEAGPVEGVALMYYQFDKFMKERYGSHIEEYMNRQRSRRLEANQSFQEDKES